MAEQKRALITGVTGQDGSYLSEFLIEKGYQVHGLKRRSSSFNTQRVDHLYEEATSSQKNFILHYGDLSDSVGLARVVSEVQPDEIYNLGAQSHVKVSFEQPEYTADVNGLGALRILEAMRFLNLKDCRFYQASTSELFGLVQEIPQKETTPFYPRSPYAVAKLFAYWTTVNYREAYQFYACNGILFNHESSRRGETFVTRKISRGLSRAALGLQAKVVLGNLDAMRDWGHAADYVEMQWLMLQQDLPEDFVIATGQQVTVRRFIELVASRLGFGIEWVSSGLSECGIVSELDNSDLKLKLGSTIIEVGPEYYRPAEVETLLGDASYARQKLGWVPKRDLHSLVDEMVSHDFAEATKESLLQVNGY